MEHFSSLFGTAVGWPSSPHFWPFPFSSSCCRNVSKWPLRNVSKTGASSRKSSIAIWSRSSLDCHSVQRDRSLQRMNTTSFEWRSKWWNMLLHSFCKSRYAKSHACSGWHPHLVTSPPLKLSPAFTRIQLKSPANHPLFIWCKKLCPDEPFPNKKGEKLALDMSSNEFCVGDKV